MEAERKTINGLLPTGAAFVEHIKRATFQAGHFWAQMIITSPELPSPSEWCWSKTAEGGWEAY
jgi:hypothetical protein